MDISTTIKFRHICDICEKIKVASKIKNKEIIFARYYESFQRHRQAYRQQNNVSPDEAENGNSSFYAVLRCLLPQVDYARKAYDLQISTLGAVYIKVLQLPDDSQDVIKLKARNYTSKYEDYGEIVFNVMRARCREEPSDLNLKEVHEMLDSIANGDRRNTEMVLTRLYELTSALEQKWFIRLILKSMGLGIGEQRIFAILHPQAKELFQRCSSLQRVCNMLADGNNFSADSAVPTTTGINLNTVITPFQHIKPMLCERFPGDIEQIMATDVLYMETKMDGERFQVHYADKRFMFLSRNGIDYTKSFGYSLEQGVYTSLLNDVWPKSLKSVILDGEMMVWDEKNECFREKGENTDVKNLSNYPSWRPCFVIYDLLYLNGKSLLDMCYVQRIYRIEELFKEAPSILQKMKPKKVGSLDEFMELFKAAMDAKAEGIVLKKQNSRYLPGVRFGGGWYKDKADYIQGLTTDFDLLIIGGFYNRTRSFIESFLLGVLQEKSPQLHEVYSVGKVANVIRQRANLNNLLKPHWKQVEQEPPPLWYHYVATNAEGRPDVWIEPRHSTILKIRAADLAPSGAFALRKSLHFPRIDAWRNDKLWNECMMLHEYKAMYEGGEKGLKKLDKRATRMEDFTVDRKRFKMTPAEKRKMGMLAYEKRFDASAVEITSDLLEGFYVCVLSGSLQKGYTAEQLKELAVKNGAELVENSLPDEPKCINIAGDENFRIELLKKAKRYDIVCIEWLLRVCEQQHLKLKAADMVSMTPALEKQFTDMRDNTEDDEMDVAFEATEPTVTSTEVHAVENLLNSITLEQLDGCEVRNSALLDLEKELFDNKSPHIFKKYYGYFLSEDPYTKLAQLQFSLRSGQSVQDCKRLVGKTREHAYIFVNNINAGDSKFVAFLARHRALIIPNNIHFVNIQWILQSHKANHLHNVSAYFCDHLFSSL